MTHPSPDEDKVTTQQMRVNRRGGKLFSEFNTAMVNSFVLDAHNTTCEKSFNQNEPELGATYEFHVRKLLLLWSSCRSHLLCNIAVQLAAEQTDLADCLFFAVEQHMSDRASSHQVAPSLIVICAAH